MFIKISNVAYTVRKNIDLRNIFIRKKRQNNDANFAKKFTKRSTFNVSEDKQRKRKLKS